MQIFEAFGIEISRFTVGRILRKNRNKFPSGDGPSLLTFLGKTKDSLWSVDLFRCESITLKSHWVMVVMDQFSRRVIGFAVHSGDCDGITYCRMFNSILTGNSPPKYLSTDNDPLFRFHRWQANLRIINIEEIKSIPYVPTSHPFVERLVGTIRRECTDQTLFFNDSDLQNKLDAFKDYYNQTRAHSSLNCKTPFDAATDKKSIKTPYFPDKTKWKSFFNNMYQLPISA